MNGHKEPVQILRFPSFIFDDIPLFKVSITIYCKYCEMFYSKKPTSEETKMYYQRRRNFLKLMCEPMTI